MIEQAYSRMADDGVRVYTAVRALTADTLLVRIDSHGFDGVCASDFELQSPAYFRANLNSHDEDDALSMSDFDLESCQYTC